MNQVEVNIRDHQHSVAGIVDLATSTFVDMGTGAGNATLVGVASVNTTAVGNVGAGDDDLMTYSLPANSLSVNGKGLRVLAWGTTANNANAKILSFKFGAVTVFQRTLTASQLGYWHAEILIFRSGANAQKLFWILSESAFNTIAANKQAEEVDAGTSETDTSAITVKFTGQGTANNDITQEVMLVEFLN